MRPSRNDSCILNCTLSICLFIIMYCFFIRCHFSHCATADMDWNRPASEIILLEAKNQVSEISDGEERKFQKDKSVSSTYD